MAGLVLKHQRYVEFRIARETAGIRATRALETERALLRREYRYWINRAAEGDLRTPAVAGRARSN
jgi:hypothetical protein